MSKILIDEVVVRQALEALEKKYGKWGQGHDELNAAAMTALRQALEQPAQEPVAWMHKIDCDRDDRKDFMVYYERTPGYCIPLYTTPPAPAKPWVGLTNDERKKLADVIRFNNIWYLEDMLRAAEEMLERKNT